MMLPAWFVWLFFFLGFLGPFIGFASGFALCLWLISRLAGGRPEEGGG